MKNCFTKNVEEEIAQKYLTGQGTLQQLADEYRCHPQTVSNIVKRCATPGEISKARSNNWKKAQCMPKSAEGKDAYRDGRYETFRTLICSYCGCAFQRKYWFKPRGKNQYCSADCLHKSRIGREPPDKIKKGVPGKSKGMKICLECGQSFDVLMCRMEERKYCSKKCEGAALSKKLGNESRNWKGGKSKEHELARHRKSYRKWREAVFVRDNYTCQSCFRRGGYLEAHHIKRFSEHPDLRYDVSNGVTLCLECHVEIDEFRHKTRPKRGRTKYVRTKLGIAENDF